MLCKKCKCRSECDVLVSECLGDRHRHNLQTPREAFLRVPPEWSKEEANTGQEVSCLLYLHEKLINFVIA